MNKNEAIKVIISSAKHYKEHLASKNVLLIYERNGKYDYIELLFLPRNFAHLTGVERSARLANPIHFFEACIQNKITVDDFDFKPDGTTILKLLILPTILNIHKSFVMIGDYNQNNILLSTEKISGNVHGCIGFIFDGNYYVPNTVLKGDIRNIVDKPTGKIIAVLKKDVNEPKYSIICSNKRDFCMDKALIGNNLESKIEMNNLVYEYAKN